LSLSLAKLVSSTSPQKPPASYTRVNDFGPHMDSIFRGRLKRESDLYASIYGNPLCFALSVCTWFTSSVPSPAAPTAAGRGQGL